LETIFLAVVMDRADEMLKMIIYYNILLFLFGFGARVSIWIFFRPGGLGRGRGNIDFSAPDIGPP
jgi:hypothetical protein